MAIEAAGAGWVRAMVAVATVLAGAVVEAWSGFVLGGPVIMAIASRTGKTRTFIRQEE